MGEGAPGQTRIPASASTNPGPGQDDFTRSEGWWAGVQGGEHKDLRRLSQGTHGDVLGAILWVFTAKNPTNNHAINF